jgi:Uma2 family endonuclease
MSQIASEPTAAELAGFQVHVPRALHLDDDRLLALCEANRDLRIERNAHGDLEIMPPTGAETGTRNSDLNCDFVIWARADGRGRVFDSSTGFLLPSGAMRAPDLAWVRRERLTALSRGQKRKFLPLVPDCLIELASPNDKTDALHAKMREWRAAGVPLGWLILPDRRQVWRYTQDAEPVCLDRPQTLGDPDLLPGLALPLARIWEPDL